MPENTRIKTSLDFIPDSIASAQDYEVLASQFIVSERLAYIAGGSGRDITLNKNRALLEQYAIYPQALPTTEKVVANTKIQLLNQTLSSPLLLAPLAYQTLVHREGEIAVSDAANATDTAMIASTLASFPLEQIANKATSQRWFQLYLQPRWQDTKDLIKRAQDAGYSAIILTIDATVQTPSLQAIRAGFVMPSHVKAANLQTYPESEPEQRNNQIFAHYQQHRVTQEQITQVLEYSDLPLIIKGVLNPQDAQTLKKLGVDALIISNHGGRTIDGVTASLAVIEHIRQQVGANYPLLFDSGVRSGNDIFKALALGANAVLIGRLQVYALAVAGALGVAHMLRLLQQELQLAMAISGCDSIESIDSSKLFKY